MLSKTLYMKRLQKNIDNNKKTLAQYDDSTTKEAIKGAAIIFVWLLEIFLSIFYLILGTKLGGTYMIILSALQVLTCICSPIIQMRDMKNLFSENIEDYKFYRLWFLFNVVIDYMYYPVAIWMLLK